MAGPAVNVVIASLLFALLATTVGAQFVFTVPVLTESFLGRLLFVNIALVVFNMLPAFPMDGERVFRALLAIRFDYASATEPAAWLGQWMAIAFATLDYYTNGFLVFIALFVYFGALQEAAHVRMKAAMNGMPVSSAMITHFHTLSEDDSLGAAAGELLSGDQQDFSVTAAGRLVGLLTRQDLLDAIAAGRQNSSVGQVMQRVCLPVRDTDLLESVVNEMSDQQRLAIPVTRNGRVVGLMNHENAREWLAIQAAVRRANVHGNTIGLAKTI